MLTRDQAQQITGDADRWHAPLNAAIGAAAVATPARLAPFLAQLAHESGGFRHLVENTAHKAATLRALWPGRFSVADAEEMAGDAIRIAERAYGGRLGNGPEGSGDGYRYRGRGLIQLTGRANYAEAGAALGLPLVEQPELLEQPAHAAASAAWFWSARNCNDYADRDDFEGLTRRINGGLHGYDDRRRRLARIREILAQPQETPAMIPAAAPLASTALSFGLGLVQSLASAFAPAAERKISAALTDAGADPRIAPALVANVLNAISPNLATAAPAAQVSAVASAQADPATLKRAEQSALAFLDAVAPFLEQSAGFDQAKWTAEREGRDAAAARAIKERGAGLWDMTSVVVWFAATTMTGLVATLLGIIAMQATTGEGNINGALIGMAGPLFMAAVAAWTAIIAYRFDGTKESSEQTRAILRAIDKSA